MSKPKPKAAALTTLKCADKRCRSVLSLGCYRGAEEDLAQLSSCMGWRNTYCDRCSARIALKLERMLVAA